MARKAAIIGGGVIGGGWAARFLLNGWDVAMFDTGPDAARKLGEVLDNARRALPALYDRALPDEGTVLIAGSLAEAVDGAAWVQESVPERLDLKHAVLAEIEPHLAPEAIVGSSTSGFTPSDLERGAADPGRILVAHPLNPVYLLPLVELVAGPAGRPEVVHRATGILTGIGMKPLLVRQEIDAHIAGRLLEAAWREALRLVRDGVATTEEIDDAIRFGFGLSWAQMGLFETCRTAGGEAGIRHFLAQVGPALQGPWSRLTDVPDLDDALVARIAGQSDAQSGHLSIRSLERLRDDNLVAILRALKRAGAAAGAILADHERGLPAPAEAGELPVTVDRWVPHSWADYNGHMNEAHYLELFGQASDRMMELIGCDAAYIAAGHSYFTVETHLCHMAEIRTGQRVACRTQLLAGDGRKLHLFHRLEMPDGTLAATGEHLLLHVDLTTRRTAPAPPEVAERIAFHVGAHAGLPRPERAGRALGARPA